jgi:hypothetical protein
MKKNRIYSYEELKARINEVINSEDINDKFENKDINSLLEELSIYHQELEMQNDELIRTHQILEKSRNEFNDLFENAPIGYIVLDSYFKIVNSNKYIRSF